MSTVVHPSELTAEQFEERRREFDHRAGTGRWNRVMRVVRRVHLYSGLFLFPWVMLYGVTALLFNHPGAFPDILMEAIPPAATGSPLYGLPSAADTAAKVIEELKKKEPVKFGDLAISSGMEPYYPFPPSANARTKDTALEFSVELTDGSGVLRIKPVPPPTPERPFLSPVAVSVPSPLVDQVIDGTKGVLAEKGYEVDVVNFRGPPDLYFEVETQGQVMPVKYNAINGTLVSVNPFSWRQYLLRLHTSHHFPHAIGARWFWAVAVDVMFGAMVFWGLSGLFMWWQIKSVRWIGLGTVVLGAVIALGMGIAMHGAMIN
jgi:hypothetical protein